MLYYNYHKVLHCYVSMSIGIRKQGHNSEVLKDENLFKRRWDIHGVTCPGNTSVATVTPMSGVGYDGKYRTPGDYGRLFLRFFSFVRFTSDYYYTKNQLKKTNLFEIYK